MSESGTRRPLGRSGIDVPAVGVGTNRWNAGGSGQARLRGGLSAADFVKVISVQELNPASLHALSPAITTLARAEGLEAHARSVEVRHV